MDKGVGGDLVSIIVPVYKVEPYLDRCMSSLLEQTYSNLEIILVDDGSPDNCPALCDEFAQRDPRVKVIHKENAGLGFARNSGLDAASGAYAAFVDSDDYCSLDMVEKLYAAAKRLDADAVYGGFSLAGPEGIRKGPGPEQETVWRGDQVRELLLDQVAAKPGKSRDTVMEVSVWRALFRRSTLEAHGIRFVSERQFISEDIIFNIDLFPHCSCIAAIPDPVYFYCLNPNSLTKTFRADRFRKVKELYQEIRRRLAPLYPPEEADQRTGRFLIARTRRNAMAVVRQRKIAGKTQERQWLAEICEDPEVQQVLHAYPIRKLPYQQFAAAFLMKLRWYAALEKLFSMKK